MPQITIDHLRYPRERSLEEELGPLIAKAKQAVPDLQQRIELQVRGFYQLVASSVQLSNLPEVAALMSEIREGLKIETPFDIFLSYGSEPRAQCTPQYSAASRTESGLTILLSQHFFNNLSPTERRVILGHELAHFVFGHLGIPSKPILEAAQAQNILGETAELLSKWSICREISCDLVGLAACGNDWQACGLALVKFTSGIDERGMTAMGGAQALIDGALAQYKRVADSVHDGILSTHPLGSLRLRILQTASASGLLLRFGEECPDDQLSMLQAELSAAIDEDVFAVYPQLRPSAAVTLEDDHIALDLSMAVAMADGQVNPGELSGIGRLLNHALDAEAFLDSLQQASGGNVASMCGQLVKRAQAAVAEKGLAKTEVVALVRRVLEVAAADGRICNAELKILFQFLEPYNVSKEELVFLAQEASSHLPT